MPSIVRETLAWTLAYVQHVVLMFYWAWIPSLLIVALISARYRPRLREITLTRRHSAAALWAAVGWGMTSGAGRRSGLETARHLWREGVPDSIVLAYLVTSQIWPSMAWCCSPSSSGWSSAWGSS